MLSDYLYNIIVDTLPFEPTSQQQDLISNLSIFMNDPSPEKVFILKGYAGTGKTSVVSALVKSLNKLQQKTVLLAPTGRAAKVLSGYSGFPAFTIHKKIYRQKSIGEYEFQLADNLHTNTLFIVDEASMISNSGGDSEFGSGFLLNDLIQYVYNGVDCSMILLGDTAQLPPVMQENSPALDNQNIAGYGLKVTSFTLTQVVRQALESGILYNATLLRKALEDNLTTYMPKLKLSTFEDIKALSGMDLVDEVQRAYNGSGVEDTIVITRSNKRANIYNNGIRGRVLMREEEISNGDLLMITRNNYFWNKPYKEIDFIANGDIVEVIRIKKYREMYGFRFVDLILRSLDFDWEIDARVWLDILHSESPAYASEMSKKLFELVSEDYVEIRNKRERLKLIFENEYMNALQVKFAYAVTCHKAQGGQWKNVFVDMGIMPDMEIDSNFYRWLYTALTRATEKIFLVNYSDKNNSKL
ncbi:AAA family ATPase [Paludibacter sp.]